MDNTEKLHGDKFRAAVEAIDRLPRNILLIATASYEQIRESNMQLCYNVFDDHCMMKPVDKISISTFVQGRLDSFAAGGKSRINIEPAALESVFERTLGNLRETFRYCYRALESNRASITKAFMIRAIADVDAPKFAALDEADKLILATLLKLGKSTLDRLAKELPGRKEIGSSTTIKRRLHGLAASGFLRMKRVKRGRTYVVEYIMPGVLVEAIKLGKLLD